ncbi:hypothetical protein Phep_2870 [Pedobacter heparinus DSM 2366]|uniref:Uncharacterized protein n=2 Tax=Pedobacter heparinus TaxID=984 RepID=C6Y1S6_PEDHD|nr:hypothetical protein Phep_2870 [Pedobacter heparinus DSM 2366]
MGLHLQPHFTLKQKNMKTINLKMPAWQPVLKNTEPYLVALIMLLLWFTAPKLMVLGDGGMGHIDPSIRAMGCTEK